MMFEQEASLISDPLVSLMLKRGEIEDISEIIDNALSKRNMINTRYLCEESEDYFAEQEPVIEHETNGTSGTVIDAVLEKSVKRALKRMKDKPFEVQLKTLTRMGMDQDTAITLITGE
jgi:hypothetical protein